MIAAAIFALGIWGTLTRKDPVVKRNVGYVYVFNGPDETALKGYKTASYAAGKEKVYEHPDIRDVEDELYNLDTSPESGNKLNIAYSSNEYVDDILYDIYDSEFNLISDDVPELSIHSTKKSKYYIASTVKWGTEKENVTMVYYFTIET